MNHIQFMKSNKHIKYKFYKYLNYSLHKKLTEIKFDKIYPPKEIKFPNENKFILTHLSFKKYHLFQIIKICNH